MITGLGLVRLVTSGDAEQGQLIATDPFHRNVITIAVNLFPFAGIAFLWVMGVLRNRLGALEDQFFATVTLGSGLLFVASLFASVAAARTLLEMIVAGHARGETYLLLRRLSYVFMNVFAVKMAAVFMFSHCAVALRTGILPRWVAFSGFGCGLLMLTVATIWLWMELIFPLWMLLVSIYILVTDLRRLS
jgi:hypothetical protein